MTKQTDDNMQVKLQQAGAYGTMHKTTQEHVPLLQDKPQQPAKQIPVNQDRAQ